MSGILTTNGSPGGGSGESYFLPGINSVDPANGSSSLQSIPTASLESGSVRQFLLTYGFPNGNLTGLATYKLIDSTDSENLPDTVVPADFDADANAKVWGLQKSSGMISLAWASALGGPVDCGNTPVYDPDGFLYAHGLVTPSGINFSDNGISTLYQSIQFHAGSGICYFPWGTASTDGGTFPLGNNPGGLHSPATQLLDSSEDNYATSNFILSPAELGAPYVELDTVDCTYNGTIVRILGRAAGGIAVTASSFGFVGGGFSYQSQQDHVSEFMFSGDPGQWILLSSTPIIPIA